MTYIEDLNVDEDVLPFFNYTNNSYAEAALRKLLKEPVEHTSVAMERQLICKGFIENWSVLHNFSYQLLYLKESYAFLTDIANHTIALGKRKFKTKLQLQFSEKERSQRRPQLVQLTLFLERIYTRYLSRTDRSKFPETYRTPLAQHC